MNRRSSKSALLGQRGSAVSGFTIVELGIVIAIIAALMLAVLSATGLIGVSKSQAILASVKDLAEAVSQFRSRYGYLPGDIPNATTVVPGVVVNSCAANPNGDGDGAISTADEVACVNYHLFNAGLIKTGTGAITTIADSKTVTIRAISRATSAIPTFPTSTRNVIEIWNVPCAMARDIDSKADDGNFATGNIRATVASCVPGPNGTNDPVPTMAVGL